MERQSVVVGRGLLSPKGPGQQAEALLCGAGARGEEGAGQGRCSLAEARQAFCEGEGPFQVFLGCFLQRNRQFFYDTINAFLKSFLFCKKHKK